MLQFMKQANGLWCLMLFAYGVACTSLGAWYVKKNESAVPQPVTEGVKITDKYGKTRAYFGLTPSQDSVVVQLMNRSGQILTELRCGESASGLYLLGADGEWNAKLESRDKGESAMLHIRGKDKSERAVRFDYGIDKQVPLFQVSIDGVVVLNPLKR
jgi:hypothetical protein